MWFLAVAFAVGVIIGIFECATGSDKKAEQNASDTIWLFIFALALEDKLSARKKRSKNVQNKRSNKY